MHFALGCMEPGLDELVSNGYVCNMNLMGNTDGHNHFTLTDKGRNCVKQCIELTKPISLLQFLRPAPSDDPDACTTLELIMMLTENGWHDEHKTPRKPTPYTQGSAKVWYHPKQGNVKPSKLYLATLLQSETLFQSGTLKELWHHQSQNYYRAVLKGYNPLPGQPLAYYKLLMKGEQPSGPTPPQSVAKTAHKPGAVAFMDEIGGSG